MFDVIVVESRVMGSASEAYVKVGEIGVQVRVRRSANMSFM